MSEKQNKLNRVQKRVRQHLSMSVREISSEMGEDRTRPKNMAYFDRLFNAFIEDSKRIVKKENGQKVVGTYCILVPEELIYAAGAVPVRLCAGSYDTVEIGEDYLPDISCPMVKSAIGFSAMPVIPLYQSCDLVVIPATCNWKVKMGEILKKFVPVLMLDLPRIKESENSRKFWLNEVNKFKQELQKLTGLKINRSRLRKAIKTIQKAQIEVRRFEKVRMSQLPVIQGKDALSVMNTYFYDHVESWTEAVRGLNDELEERLCSGKTVCSSSAPRILLTGSPIIFPNWKVPALIEESGGILVADEFCTSNRYLHDMVALDELSMSDMIHAIADRYLLPCTCPIFSDTLDRRNRISQMSDDYQVEGVIYHILKGCHPYDAEMKTIEEMLKDKGIPQLKIETDFSPEDVEQIRTRIEAFIETIKGRRR